MRPIQDNVYSDVFLCSEEGNFHDYYYVSPEEGSTDSLRYCINRTGIESKIPSVFTVERKDGIQCCEIFCIFSGKGRLWFRGEVYGLEKNQIVVLPSEEPHRYESDPQDPLGMSWIEFYGGDSSRLVRHIVDTQGVILDGKIFLDISSRIGALQQKIMVRQRKSIALDLYQILFELLENETGQEKKETLESNAECLKRALSYIEAHLSEKIENKTLAKTCSMSLSCFLQLFKKNYGVTPQEYVMNRRIQKSKFMLLQTNQSVEVISEQLGFCNPSHFIRKFRGKEQMTPAKYRNCYGKASLK